MILAGQFEFFWQPFVVLMTVPMFLIGVTLILGLTGSSSLNMIVLLGVILLGCIVVNNRVVLIEYINILSTKGKDKEDVMVEATSRRVGPVLMTALSMPAVPYPDGIR